VQVRSLGFRTDLMLRRLSGSRIEDRGPWLVVRTPSNPGYWWGNYLLLTGPLRPGSAAAWDDRFAAEFPAAAHRAFGIDGVSGEVGDGDAVRALRVEVDVSTVLTASVTTVRIMPYPASSDAVCRRLESDADWEQALELHLACDDFDDTPDHRDFRRRKLVEEREMVSAGFGAWLGAFAGDGLVAALGIFSDGSGLARYQNVETHPDHRRRGHARRLLVEAARYAASQLAARRLVIVADLDYHAVDLYRSVGFVDAERQVQLQRRPATDAPSR
jgi:ribosomal protein S18 acetylase RimI-like enzyme